MRSDSTTINVPESSAVAEGKAPQTPAPRPENSPCKKGIAIFDFIIRLCAVVSTLAAAAAMELVMRLFPSSLNSFSSKKQKFVIIEAMAIVGGFLVLSLPFSIVTIVRPHAVGPRLLLIVLATVALTLTTAAGGAAAAIVYLSHNGNTNTNWLAICQQFGNFCQKISGAVVASFISVVLLMVLELLSALALQKH